MNLRQDNPRPPTLDLVLTRVAVGPQINPRAVTTNSSRSEGANPPAPLVTDCQPSIPLEARPGQSHDKERGALGLK